MRLLQTGDWHLGKNFFELSLVDDQRFFLDQIRDELRAAEKSGRRYEALVVPGDIYDRAVPPSDAVTLFSRFLTETHRTFPDLHLFFLAGNHDSASRLSFAAALLGTQNIHICTDTQTLTTPVLIGPDGDQVAVYQLPYLTPGSINRRTVTETGPQQDLFAENDVGILRTQQQLVEEAAAQIAAAHTETYGKLPAVLCAHLFTLGSVQSESERSFAGPTEQVDSAVFAPFAYTALGHLHKVQQCGSGSVWYSGSPLAYSFGDEPAKYLLDVTVTADESVVRKIPVRPLHPVVRLEGPFEQFYEADPAPYRNSYIEIQCTDTVIRENAMPLLRTKYPFIVSFVRKQSDTSGENSSVAARRSLIEGSGQRAPGEIFDLFMHDIYGDQMDDPLSVRERGLFVELAGQEASE